MASVLASFPYITIGIRVSGQGRLFGDRHYEHFRRLPDQEYRVDLLAHEARFPDRARFLRSNACVFNKSLHRHRSR